MSAAPDDEQRDPEHPRPRQRDLLDAEPAVAVDDRGERELCRDEERRRRDDADPRAGDRDGEDDEDAHRRRRGAATSGPAIASPTPASERRATSSTASASTTPTTDGGRHRFHAPDTFAEPSLHGDLDGSAEARRESEHGGERGRAHARGRYTLPGVPDEGSDT